MEKVNDSALKQFDIRQFSGKAVHAGAIKLIFQQGLVLWPSGLGLISLLGGFFIAEYFFAIFSACLLVATGSFIVNYFFREDYFIGKYMAELQKRNTDENRQKLIFLEEELKKIESVRGIEDFCKQSLHQFRVIQDKFSIFQNFLAKKLNKEELTFGRYLGAAEQVYLSVLDNLTDIANLLNNVVHFDSDHMDERIKELERIKILNKDDEEELKAIEERKTIKNQQVEKIEKLITKNEEAITQFDKTSAAVNDIRKKGMAEIDTETALRELEELAQNSRRYSVE